MSLADPPSAPVAAPNPKRRRWPRWVAEIGLVVLLVFGIQWWQARDVPRGPAPAFAAPMADGGSGSLAEWRAAHPGRTIGIYFWAEWCPICKMQEGSIDALRGHWPVFTVAMQSGDAAKVAKALRSADSIGRPRSIRREASPRVTACMAFPRWSWSMRGARSGR